MAVALQALLNIKANVQGEGAVGALGRTIGGLQGKASAAAGGLQGLTKSAGMGGLAGAMGMLTPLLSAAGLGAMAKGAIDAADNMNDLRQKTGVSVETLSKFEQAANASGTNIDGVGKAMLKLNKGLGQLATEGKGPVKDALAQLGISAKDASGKMLGADEIMLRVADKFKSMPDGAEKTAIAMQLFGKAGADMIPMLNGGRDSIESLEATMSGKFAAGADNLNDKLAAIQGSLLRVAVQVGEALMPALNILADGVAALASGLSSLPGPLQALVVGAAGLAIAWGPITGLFAGLVGVIGGIGPVIAGAMSAVGAFVGGLSGLGAAITGTLTVIAGFITWPVVLVAALVAAGVAIFVFRDQIGAFFNSLGQLIADLVQAIWDMGEPIRAFWVGLWDGIKNLTGPFFSWLGETARAAFDAMVRFAYQLWVQPFVSLWETIRGPVLAFFGWLAGTVQAGWQALATAFQTVVGLLQAGWGALRNAAGSYFSWLGDLASSAFSGLARFAYQLWVQPFVSLWGTIRGAAAGFFSWLTNIAGNVFEVLVDGWAAAVDVIGELFGRLARLFDTYYVRPLVNLATGVWNMLRSGWQGLSGWVANLFQSLGRAFSTYVTGPISNAWRAIVDTSKAALRGLLQWAANAMNGVIRMINSVLSGVNRVRAALGMSTFGLLGELRVPAFAEGGFVTGPTLAMIGDNPGGREYVVPEGKAAGFAANYLAGARGAAAIPTSSSSGNTAGGAAGPITVNLSTGPVMQQQDGSRYITLEDAERMVRQGISDTIRQLRTPAGRYAMGVR